MFSSLSIVVVLHNFLALHYNQSDMQFTSKNLNEKTPMLLDAWSTTYGVSYHDRTYEFSKWVIHQR